MYIYELSNLTLHTTYDFPPIPIRDYDWSCVDDNYDGAPDAGRQLHGRGKTELEAVLDYFDQLLSAMT